MRKRCELAYLLGGDDSSELPDLIAAAQDSLPFSHQSLIAVGTEIPVKQENTWVKQECVAKYTPGNFGWMDVGDPKDCQVELPSTIPDPLWVVGQQSALNIVNGLGCTENLITGTIYVLVFDEGVGPINNSTPAPAEAKPQLGWTRQLRLTTESDSTANACAQSPRQMAHKCR